MSPRTDKQFEKMRSDSKRKIIQAALELFANRGYSSTSISQVAKQAGVSKGLMYNYFDSKEDLLEEVVKMNIEDGVEMGEEIMGALQEMPIDQMIEHMIDMFFEIAEEKKDLFKLSFALSLQVSDMPKIQHIIFESFSKAVEMMKAMLLSIGIVDNTVEAKLLAAQLDGIIVHSYVFGEEYDLGVVKQGLKDRIKLMANIKK